MSTTLIPFCSMETKRWKIQICKDIHFITNKIHSTIITIFDHIASKKSFKYLKIQRFWLKELSYPKQPSWIAIGQTFKAYANSPIGCEGSIADSYQKGLSLCWNISSKNALSSFSTFFTNKFIYQIIFQPCTFSSRFSLMSSYT